jgi:hypothetical protein
MIILFVLFALPIPVFCLIGSLFLTNAVFYTPTDKAGATWLNSFAMLWAAIPPLLAFTYVITYYFSLSKTRIKKAISFVSFLPLMHMAFFVFSTMLWLKISPIVINDVSDYESRLPERFVCCCAADSPCYIRRGRALPDVFPRLADLPKNAKIDYEYRESQNFIFTTYTTYLVVAYDEAAFEYEKAKLAEQSFLGHIVYDARFIGTDAARTLLPEYEFSINSYDFRVLDNDYIFPERYDYYPKTIFIIGISDEKNSIAYLHHYNFDIDYISDSMASFVARHFKYKW